MLEAHSSFSSVCCTAAVLMLATCCIHHTTGNCCRTLWNSICNYFVSLFRYSRALPVTRPVSICFTRCSVSHWICLIILVACNTCLHPLWHTECLLSLYCWIFSFPFGVETKLCFGFAVDFTWQNTLPTEYWRCPEPGNSCHTRYKHTHTHEHTEVHTHTHTHMAHTWATHCFIKTLATYGHVVYGLCGSYECVCEYMYMYMCVNICDQHLCLFCYLLSFSPCDVRLLAFSFFYLHSALF